MTLKLHGMYQSTLTVQKPLAFHKGINPIFASLLKFILWRCSLFRIGRRLDRVRCLHSNTTEATLVLDPSLHPYVPTLPPALSPWVLHDPILGSIACDPVSHKPHSVVELCAAVAGEDTLPCQSNSQFSLTKSDCWKSQVQIQLHDFSKAKCLQTCELYVSHPIVTVKLTSE